MPDDPFHIGSVGKPLTATVVARLVEREYRYSNAHFILAASMAEAVSARSWEALVEEQVFAVAVVANACSEEVQRSLVQALRDIFSRHAAEQGGAGQ